MQASISGLYNPSSVPHNDHLITDDDAESEFAEEVDQLDTESEHEEEAAPDSDPYEEISRSMGDSLLPADVVERIIDAEGVTGALAMSKEALFVLSVGTEEFMNRITNVAELYTITEDRTTVTYKDIASVTEQYQEFFFLRDTIPPPLTVQEALRRREQKQKEDEENDPALATASAVPFSPSSAPTTVQPKASRTTVKGGTKEKGSTKEKSGTKEKSSTKEKANGSSSSKRTPSIKSRSSSKKDKETNGIKGLRAGEVGAEAPWTRWVHEDGPDDTMIDPALSAMDNGMDVDSGGQFSWNVTSTAGEGGSNGSGTFQNTFASQSSSNPGRTIYSQKR